MIYFNISYLSIRSLSFKRNLSLSSSATFTSFSSRLLRSWNPSVDSSTSLSPPLDVTRIPFLSLSNVGSFSSAAHFRASSSSSSLEDLEKTSAGPLLCRHEELFPADLKLALALYMSPPSIR